MWKLKDGGFSLSWRIVWSPLISFDEIKSVGSSKSCHNSSLERNNE